MGDLFKRIKSSPIALLWIIFLFFVSGLIVNFVQLMILVLWPINKAWYRWLIGYVSYLHWAETTFVAEWWGELDITFYGSEKDFSHLGKEHAIVLANHRSDVDWLAGWVLAERTNCLKGAKCFVKNEMKYVPTIGWAWWFGEFGFLKRSWDKDGDYIKRVLAALAEFPYPFWICIFAEGTRYTKEKFAASQEYAKSKGIQSLKHHLLPRPKGFAVTAQALKGKVPAVYDMQIAFPGDKPPTVATLITGQRFKVDIYVRRIPMDDIPCETVEEAAQWCKDLFREKDVYMDHYLQEGCFPFPVVKVPRRRLNLIVVIAWNILLLVPVVYTFLHLVSFTWFSFTVMLSSCSLLMLLFNWVVGKSETKKGSSFGLPSVAQTAESRDASKKTQ